MSLATVWLCAAPTTVEETNVTQSSRLRGSLFQLIKCLAILHDTVPLLLSITEEVDLGFATGCGIRLGLGIAASAAQENVDLGAKRVRVPNLMLSDLLVRIVVCNVSGITCRGGVVNGRCHHEAGLATFHLGGFENGTNWPTVVIYCDSYATYQRSLLCLW